MDPLEDWIEEHLDDDLTLEQIARQAGLSTFHFSRLFTARSSRSPMAYVRCRRLIKAARRLTNEPGTALVDIALDTRFESQESFTRAFKRLFGVSPGRFRRGFAVEPPEGQPPMTVSAPDRSDAVVQLPELVALPAFRVAGPSRMFDQVTKAGIPQLWPRLVGALPFEGQTPSWATYGVVAAVDRDEGSFRYMAGVGVTADCVPPPGFDTMEIPAGTYLVFRITLDGSALHPQVKQAMARIWGELVPASGRKLAGGPDFELYDGRFDPMQAGSVIDFHVPVQA